jgi:hypothetical protein
MIRANFNVRDAISPEIIMQLGIITIADTGSNSLRTAF